MNFREFVIHTKRTGSDAERYKCKVNAMKYY